MVMIKHKEFYEKYFAKGRTYHDNLDELRDIMPYHFDDKKVEIRTIVLKWADGSVIRKLPVYRVILDSRNKDDLMVMIYEESERAIMFSDILLDDTSIDGKTIYREATDEVSVDYIVENLPQFVQDAIEEEKWDLHWGAYNGVDVNRYYADVEFNKGLDYYYNNVRKEDDRNLEIIKDMIERNAKIKVEIL